MTESERELRLKSKAHVYKNSAGIRIPSVTTITHVLGVPEAVVTAANKLGLEGIDSKKHWEDKAAIGTLAHALILAPWTGDKEEDLKDGYTKAQIDLATNCHLSFLAWAKGKKIEPLYVEKPLISERFQYGGKFDFYGLVDLDLTLLDLKTGSGIYAEHWYQLGGYRNLLEENGVELPKKYSVLNIPRAENESFDVQSRTNLDTEWEIFKRCLDIYRLQKKAR
jgi:hypothetical protein